MDQRLGFLTLKQDNKRKDNSLMGEKDLKAIFAFVRKVVVLRKFNHELKKPIEGKNTL